MSFSRLATFKQIDALESLLHLPMPGKPADIDGLLRHVNALENAIGVTLVESSNQTIRLTAAGFVAARSFAESMTRLRAGVATLQQQPAADEALAPFRFGAPWWVDLAHVGDVEAALLAVSGAPDIDFTFDSSTECSKRVQLGQLDGALVIGPVETGQCKVSEVAKMEAMAALPAGHPLAGRRQIELDELNAMPAIAMFKKSINPDQDRHIRQCFSDLGLIPKKIIRVADAPSMLQLVATGKAAALVNAAMPATLRPAGVALRSLSPRASAVLAGPVLLILRKESGIAVSDALLRALKKLLTQRDPTRPTNAS